MNPCSPSSNRTPRTFTASLLLYVLIFSQLAPMAFAASASELRSSRRVPLGKSDQTSSSAESQTKETYTAPVPQPLSAPATAPLAVNIVATKTDNRTAAQTAVPGDTINYTVVIQNTGTTDATAVQLTDIIDANTTLVPSSIQSTPLANNDTFNVIGNVRIQPNAAQGLLANDFNPDNGNATGITASGPSSTLQGGNLTINSDGSFSYNPAPGFAGTDTFTYTLTVTATGKTDTGTVTLLVGNGTSTPGTNVVWFVNPAAPAGGDGRLTSPFNCYTGGVASCFSQTAADDPGDGIFFYAGALTGGYALLANQKVIGAGAGATLATIAGLTVPTASDALPATNNNPAGVTVTTVLPATNAMIVSAGGIVLRGFTVGNTTGAKIFGSAFGTLTAGDTTTPDLTLNGTGQALNLTNGTFAATSALGSVTTTSSTGTGITLSQVAGTVALGSTTVSASTSQGILVSQSTLDINFGNTAVGTAAASSGGTNSVSLQNNTSGTRTFGTLTIQNNTGSGQSAFLSTAGGNTVAGTTTLSGIVANGFGIDVRALAAGTSVSFGTTSVTKTTAGAAVSLGISGSGNAGNVSFLSLNATNSSGDALIGVANTGSITVTNNTGSLSATSGVALNLTKAAAPATPITLNFTNVSSTNSGTQGVILDRVSGNLTIATTTITNPTGIGINVLNTSAGGTMNFGNTTSNASAGAGVSLGTNGGAVTFNALNIAPDAGVAAFSLASSTGTTSSSSGTINTTDAPAVSVTSSPLSMTLTSVSADNTGDTDSCVSLTGATGTLTMQGGTLTGGTAAAFSVSGGSVNATYSGNVSQASAQRIVNVDGTTGGTITFNTGTVTSTGSSTGININNTNGGVSFANITHGTSGARLSTQAVTITGGTGTYSLGAVSIFTTGAAGQGIVATNADGTLNIMSGTVNSAGATALNIDGPVGFTTLGVTLTTVAASGGTNGMLVQDTNGAFTVNGTGTTDGTGGTIQNTTGRGASFINATSIRLKNMNFTNAGTTDLDATNGGLSTGDNLATNAAIHLQTVTNVDLDNINISGGAEQGINGNTVANFRFADSSITNVGNAADEDNIHFFNMSGTSSITNTTLTHTSGGGDDNMNLQTNAGNLDLLISGGSATGIGGGVQQLGSGYLFGIRGTTTANITFEGASSTNNFSGGIVADVFEDATMNLRVNNSTSSGNNDQLSVSAGDNSLVDLEVTGNTLSSVATNDFVVISLTGSAFDNGFIFDARIANNTISVANGLNADGISVNNAGGGVMNVAITNNTFTYAGTQRGINVQGGSDGAGTARVIITDNDMDVLMDGAGNAVNGILAVASLTNAEFLMGQPPPTSSGNNFKLDLNIGGAGVLANTFTHSIGGAPAGGDIRVRQRFQGFVNLDGYGGTSMDTAAAVAYLNGRNNEVTSSTATVDTTGSLGGGGIVADPADTVGPGFTGNTTPPFITVSVSPASVNENSGTPLVYTLTRTGNTAGSLVANFNMTGTASFGGTPDYTVTGATTFNTGTGAGTVTFNAGSATTIVNVTPNGDATAEFNEAVVLDVGNSTTANGSFARAVITNDDAAPFLTSDIDSSTANTDSKVDTLGAVADKTEALRVPDIPVSNRLTKDVSWIGIETEARGVGESLTTHEGNKPQARKEKPVDAITPNVANFPITIGTLGAGKTVTITFSVTVNNPLPAGITQVSNQGTVSGSNFSSVLTDDPDVAGTSNPTVTGVAVPDIFVRDARVAEPTSGSTNMVFTVTLSNPAATTVAVNFTTADEPAGPGKAVAGSDYTATSGTVNFTTGQQVKSISVPVLADADGAEPDETFLLNLSGPVNGNISDGQAVGTITAANTPGVTLISELRTSGPSGTNDDFVEIYNNTNSPLTVAASDASAGYGLFKSAAGDVDTPVLIGTIPNGTVIPARGHYLMVGSTYSLTAYAASNLVLTADIENDRNVGLFSTANIANLSSTNRLDAVGFGPNTGGNFDLLREGSTLGTAAGSTAQYSFVRKLTSGLPQDTNDNAADFVTISTDSSVSVGTITPILGGPGPENLASPLQRSATIKASLVDPAQSANVTPNRIRDTNSYTDGLTPSTPNGVPGTPYTLGTLLIRRKFTNNTAAPVTRLRFRVVDISTTNAPPPGQADVRALTSATQPSVTITGGGTIVVNGLTLEQVPTQARGGGLNSSLAAGTVTVGTPIAVGSSINVNFLLGVATGGSYRFFIIVEALP